MSTSTEAQKYNRIDSSDDEREELVPSVESGSVSYINTLVQDINPRYVNSKHGELALRCGLILHHYADRAFNRGDIRRLYQEQERIQLSLDPGDLGVAIEEIKKLLTKSKEYLPNLFNDDLDVNSLDPKEIKQIFNYAFNDKVEKPFSLKASATKADLLSTFKEAYSSSSDIDLSFLHKHQNLVINIQEDQPMMFPVAAELIRRSARDLSKEIQLLGQNRESTTTINLGKIAGSTIKCIAHKSGNIQLALLVGADTYESEAKNLKAHASNIEQLIKTGTMPANLTMQEKAIVTELASLMGIAEVVRSKAAIFTTPMFLDMLQAAPDTTSYEDYPMAAKNAVSTVRRVHAEYKDLLPNARKMDEDGSNIQDYNIMLMQEGKLLSQWAVQKDRTQLANLFAVLMLVDALSPSRVTKDTITNSECRELWTKLDQAYKGNTTELSSIGITEEFVTECKDTIPNTYQISRKKIAGNAQLKYEQLRSKHEELKELYNPAKVSELLNIALAEAIGAIDEHILGEYYRVNPQNIFSQVQQQHAVSSPREEEPQRSYESLHASSVQAIPTTGLRLAVGGIARELGEKALDLVKVVESFSPSSTSPVPSTPQSTTQHDQDYSTPLSTMNTSASSPVTSTHLESSTKFRVVDKRKRSISPADN